LVVLGAVYATTALSFGSPLNLPAIRKWLTRVVNALRRDGPIRQSSRR
jgi:hypothetical protein